MILALLAGCTDAVDTGPLDRTCPDTTLEHVARFGRADLAHSGGPTGEPWSEHPNFGGPGLALVDVNGDGWLDLAVADPLGNSRLLINRDGTLTPSDSPIPQGHALAAGDVTGDGDVDLIVGRWEDTPDLLGTGDGAGGFTWTELPRSNGHTLGWTLADIDGDGDLDAFAARHYELVNDQDVAEGRITGWGSFVYRNQGGALVPDLDATPTWTQEGLSFMGQWLDVEGDGDLDLYLVNDFGPYLVPNVLMLNDGAGRFTPSEDPTTSAAMYGMGAAVDDVNGDGWPDLYVSNIGSPLLLVGDGQGRFIDSTAALGAQIPASDDRLSSWGIELADLDRDGLPDATLMFGAVVFWMQVPYVEDSDGVRWDDALEQPDALLWNQGGAFAMGPELQDTDVGRSVVAGDVDQDGKLELITGHWTPDLAVRVDVTSVQGGCEPAARVSGPIGTRVQGPHGTSWILPATTFSTGPLDVWVGLAGDPTGTLVITPPGGAATTHTVTPDSHVTVE